MLIYQDIAKRDELTHATTGSLYRYYTAIVRGWYGGIIKAKTDTEALAIFERILASIDAADAAIKAEELIAKGRPAATPGELLKMAKAAR